MTNAGLLPGTPAATVRRQPAEQALVFDCAGQPLVGVVSLPAPDAAPRTGVVVVVGGPQYRAGSHRQFVHLARAVAAAGHAALRFDYRGMGDSLGAPGHFERLDTDIDAAIGALQRAVPSVQRVVLWGLCDGASAALTYWQASADPRVTGLCLANPWVRSEASQARAQVKHYYAQRLRQKAFWAKLLSGQVALSALGELRGSLVRALRPRPSSLATAPVQDYRTRMALAWQAFPGGLLLLLSGVDLVAKEFLEAAGAEPAWRGALARPNLERHDLPEADHTFSDNTQRQRAEVLTCAWLDRL